MERLFEYICDKSARGIPHDEAVQMILLLYCTLDCLPAEFRCLELSRNNLAGLFAKLSAAGKVIASRAADLGYVPLSLVELASQKYWDDLITKLLRAEIRLDDSFRDRVHRYL